MDERRTLSKPFERPSLEKMREDQGLIRLGAAPGLNFTLVVAGAAALTAFDGAPLHWEAPIWRLALWVAAAAVASIVANRHGAAKLGFSLSFLALLALEFGPLAAVAVECLVRLGLSLQGGFAWERLSRLADVFAAASLSACALLWLWPFGIFAASAGFLAGWAVVEAAQWAWRRHALKESLRGLPVPTPLLAFVAALNGLAVVAACGLFRDGVSWTGVFLILPALAFAQALAGRAALLSHYYGTVAAMTQMLQRAHPYTGSHVARVAEFAERTALRLGLTARRSQLVREAAVLHDIGKIAVDERILDKPGSLTPEERAAVERHCVCGAEILGHVKEFSEVAVWIRSHHERPDGKGYPDRLFDGEIPLESKIIAVADAYDAMTSDGEEEGGRAYRRSISEADALVELERCSGSQFDAKVVRAFREAVLEGSTR